MKIIHAIRNFELVGSRTKSESRTDAEDLLLLLARDIPFTTYDELLRLMKEWASNGYGDVEEFLAKRSEK